MGYISCDAGCGISFGALAQLGERCLCKAEVVGSIPTRSTSLLSRHGGTHVRTRDRRQRRGQAVRHALGSARRLACRCARVRPSACSARTAAARARCSAFSARCCGRAPAPRAFTATTWCARRTRCAATLGFLAHTPGLYDDLTARENLRFAATMLGVGRRGRSTRRARARRARARRRRARARLFRGDGAAAGGRAHAPRQAAPPAARRAVQQPRRRRDRDDERRSSPRPCTPAARRWSCCTSSRPRPACSSRTRDASGDGRELMAWRDDWRRVRAIAWKDLTAERRSKAGFNGVVALGVTILVLFGFALGPDTQAIRDAAAGALWLAALFSGGAGVQPFVSGRARERRARRAAAVSGRALDDLLRGSCSRTSRSSG